MHDSRSLGRVYILDVKKFKNNLFIDQLPLLYNFKSCEYLNLIISMWFPKFDPEIEGPIEVDGVGTKLGTIKTIGYWSQKLYYL